MSVEVVLASGNPHKLIEIRRILEPEVPRLVLRPHDGPEPVESGVTFEENALIKARAAAAATKQIAIADDSGLSVDVLGGSPGIFSARWAGPARDDKANRELLLWQLADLPAEHRGARFVCVAALVTPEGRELTVRGEWEGRILTAAVGTGGFGYDPVFAPLHGHRSAAELSAAEKDAVSHRRAAFAGLVEYLRALESDDSAISTPEPHRTERRSS